MKTESVTTVTALQSPRTADKRREKKMRTDLEKRKETYVRRRERKDEKVKFKKDGGAKERE